MKLIKFIIRNILDLIFDILIIFIIVIISYKIIINTNNKLDITEYEYKNTKINNEIKVVQISDLHNYNTQTGSLLQTIFNLKPDLVVATGDMFDATSPDILNTYLLFAGLRSELDCEIVYIPGNHEITKQELYGTLKDKIHNSNLDITILENESKVLNINGNNINIIGMDNKAKYSAKILNDIINKNNNFNLVLCHQPENFKNILNDEETYLKGKLQFDMNLILSGHAHGGQIRILEKGLFSPGQGWFPEYTSGMFNITPEETLIISRGLGNSTFPVRVNNNPEIVVINIKNNKEIEK